MFFRCEGKLTNDNEGRCDRLGYDIYAESLAKSLHESPAPMTVGIFGSWGVGKTFMANRVQGMAEDQLLLNRPSIQQNIVLCQIY